MDVIRHNDVTANGDAVFVIRTFGKANEFGVDGMRRKKWPAPMCADGYKENRVG